MFGINYDVCSMGDVLKMWQEMTAGEEEDKTSVSKRFQYILKNKLKLSQEEIGWFKEKMSNKIDRFVFQADIRVHVHLNDVLYIYGKRNAVLTLSEAQKLIGCFAAMLPYPIDEGTEQTCLEIFNRRLCRMEQAVRDYCSGTSGERLYEKRLFVKVRNAKWDKEKRREFYQDQYKLVKDWRDKWVSIMRKAGEIRKAERVECLYMGNGELKNMITQDDEKIFCETGKTDNKIIQEEYKKMKRICEEDLCQYVLYLFITGGLERKRDGEKGADKAIEEDAGTMDGCVEACAILFREVINHQLKTDSMEDFEYMVKVAIKELETISTILHQNDKARERRKASLYPEVEILGKHNKPNESLTLKTERQKCRVKLLKSQYCTEEDLQNLSNIRRFLNEKEKETISILDYK